MTEAGWFLVFEGIDGCGKSTQVARVAEARGALATFEMGATELGAALRGLILGDGDGEAAVPMAEAMLISADRAQHVATVIEPALAEGRDVVSDRFAASTLAYQGYGRSLALEDLVILTELATGGRRPDLTILLDLSVERSLERRGGDPDRIERQDKAFFERVRAGYLAQATAEPERWVVLDASRSLDEVSAAIDAAIAERGW
jgi:dTMP kinase